MSKIRKGSTVEDTPEKAIIKQFVKQAVYNSDFTGTDKKLQIGPGQYDSCHNLVKKNAAASMSRMVKDSVGEHQKNAIKESQQKRFDGTGATIKQIKRHIPEDLKELEERV